MLHFVHKFNTRYNFFNKLFS